VKYNMSVLTQHPTVCPREARPLKIAPEAIYTSSLKNIFSRRKKLKTTSERNVVTIFQDLFLLSSYVYG